MLDFSMSCVLAHPWGVQPENQLRSAEHVLSPSADGQNPTLLGRSADWTKNMQLLTFITSMQKFLTNKGTEACHCNFQRIFSESILKITVVQWFWLKLSNLYVTCLGFLWAFSLMNSAISSSSEDELLESESSKPIKDPIILLLSLLLK